MVEERSGAQQWDGGWGAHRQAQLRARLRPTPEQLLAWLEEAIAWVEAVRADRAAGRVTGRGTPPRA